jgi:uncharacterized protein
MSTVLESREEVIAEIRGLAPRLRALGVERLALFGSFVRDAQRPASDVDLLVTFAAGCKTFDNFTAAYDLLEAALGRSVELVTIESLSPYIGPNILREAEDVIVSA